MSHQNPSGSASSSSSGASAPAGYGILLPLPQGMSADTQFLFACLQKMSLELAATRQEMAEMKQEMAEMKQEMAEMKQEMASLKESVQHPPVTSENPPAIPEPVSVVQPVPANAADFSFPLGSLQRFNDLNRDLPRQDVQQLVSTQLQNMLDGVHEPHVISSLHNFLFEQPFSAKIRWASERDGAVKLKGTEYFKLVHQVVSNKYGYNMADHVRKWQDHITSLHRNE